MTADVIVTRNVCEEFDETGERLIVTTAETFASGVEHMTIEDYTNGSLEVCTFKLVDEEWVNSAQSFDDQPSSIKKFPDGAIKIEYHTDGVLDRKDGPAMITVDGRGNRAEYYISEGELRTDVPSAVVRTPAPALLGYRLG